MRNPNQAPAKKERENNLRFILRKLMHEAHISEPQLARTLGMPVTTLNQLLRSETISPRLETLLPIAKYFNVYVEQLVGAIPLGSPRTEQKTFKVQAQPNNEKKIWKPELYLECVNTTCKILKKKNFFTSAEKALEIIQEVYFYSLQRGSDSVDDMFAEWFVTHALSD